VRWVSPAGGAPGPRDGLVYVPFEWQLVDAFFLMERFGALREALGFGDDAAVDDPLALASRLSAQLEVATGGQQTLILHPFLMLDRRWWSGVQGLLARLGALAASGAVWVGPVSRL